MLMVGGVGGVKPNERAVKQRTRWTGVFWGRLKVREWKMRHGQNNEGGNCKSGKCRRKSQGWKMQEWKLGE